MIEKRNETEVTIGDPWTHAVRWWARQPAVVVPVVTSAAAFLLFVWSLAPGLTSADGGDFVTAAFHFGVPHPSGYPLWTILGWLFTRLPITDPAFATNLLSAVCSSIAVGGIGGLSWATCRSAGATTAQSAALGFLGGLFAAVTRPVWSQAVITEVYGLHVACGVALLVVLRRWLSRPNWTWGFASAVGVLALGLSNHHLTLTLIPLPVAVLLMVRPEGWQELLTGTMLAAVVLLRGWAGLSGDPGVIQLAQRMLEVMVVAALVVLMVRRRPRAWLGPLRVVIALVAGLLPYLYLPLAAATDPVLCWSCPTTGRAFFHLTNLTIYWGSHTGTLFKIAGETLGVSPSSWASGGVDATRRFSDVIAWLFSEYAAWISLPMVALAIIALIGVLGAQKRDRRWIITLGLTLVCSGFILPLATGLDASLEHQKVLRTYLGLPAAVLALVAVAGAGWLCAGIRRLLGTVMSWGVPAVVAVALVTVAWSNEPTCNRRGNNIAEELLLFLLDGLPQDTIVLASSDTVFFGANAMVEVMSLQPSAAFTRDDLAVITPVRLSNASYLDELHRNYGDRANPDGLEPKRPLRRATLINLPTMEMRDEVVASLRAVRGSSAIHRGNGILTEQLVAANVDTRFIAMEMPIPFGWVLAHARPDGFWLRLMKEPVADLSVEEIANDLARWDAALGEFETKTGWAGDLDLRLSVADLRIGGGHVYRHRGLCRAAEAACRQALRAAPESERAAALLVEVLRECGDLPAARRAAEIALRRDPHNPRLSDLVDWVQDEDLAP